MMTGWLSFHRVYHKVLACHTCLVHRLQTALHKAAWYGYRTVCKLLVEAGASLTRKDYQVGFAPSCFCVNSVHVAVSMPGQYTMP